MNPTTEKCLRKARESLRDAEEIAGINIALHAARLAYQASFHAANALIVEHTGQVPKTHSGTHALFSKLANEPGGIGRQFSTFLGRAYDYKSRADYEYDGAVELDELPQIFAMTRALLDAVAAAIDGNPSDP